MRIEHQNRRPETGTTSSFNCGAQQPAVRQVDTIKVADG
jgi:hypothetical protein